MSSPSSRLYLFLMLSCLQAYGQESLGTFTGLYATHFDSKTRIHVRIYRDSIAFIRMPQLAESGQTIRGIGELAKGSDIRRIDDELYFVDKSGGMVYRLSGDSLRRIDQSFQHLMQSFSLTFIQDRKIYRHGGYGFWSARRELTYFNTMTREWDIVAPLKSKAAPKGLYNHIRFPDATQLTIIGGKYLEVHDPVIQQPNTEVWSFDFREKQWTQRGEIPEAAAKILNDGHPGIEMDNAIVILHRNISVFDIRENLITNYEAAPIQYLLSADPDIKPFYDDGYFYFYRIQTARPDPNKGPQSLELIRVSRTDVLGKALNRETLISSPENFQLLWFIPLMLFIPLFFYVRRKRGASGPDYLQLTDSGLSYKNKSMPLSQPELAIIRLLLSSETEVSTNQVLDVTQNPNLDYTHKLRVKNQMIEKLNVGLRTLLNIQEDVITSERSAIDRRIRTYSIRKEYFKPASQTNPTADHPKTA